MVTYLSIWVKAITKIYLSLTPYSYKNTIKVCYQQDIYTMHIGSAQLVDYEYNLKYVANKPIKDKHNKFLEHNTTFLVSIYSLVL